MEKYKILPSCLNLEKLLQDYSRSSDPHGLGQAIATVPQFNFSFHPPIPTLPQFLIRAVPKWKPVVYKSLSEG